MDQPSDSIPAQTLSRARIIRRRSIFDATRLKGHRVANRWMSLNVLSKGGDLKTGTVAFLTPKRLGNATVRNRLRRRMREIYRRHLAQPSEPAYLVWVARPPAVELDFTGLKEIMQTLKRKI